MARRPKAAAPRNVVLYIRVSALMGRGGDDFHSPDVQRVALERHVAPLGLKIVDVISDIDVTGQTFTRDGIDQLRRLVDAGKVDAVGLYDLSRLGRNVNESLTFIGWLRERGVTVLSTKEQIDDSPTGQFMLTQFLGLAQLHGDQIGQRWAEIIEARAHQGIQHGTASIGYRKENKRLVVDPVMGPAVTDAFTRYANGWTISDITEALNRVRDTRVDRRVVKAMFSKPVYRGMVVLHGEVTPGIHEALVDDTTWGRVQARLERDRSIPPRTLAVSHSLTGVLLCDPCGRTLKRNDEYQKSGKRVPRVTCSYAYKLYGRHRCGGIGNPRLDLIESAAIQWVGAFVERLQSDHRAQMEVMVRRAHVGSTRKELVGQLAAAQTALGRLAAKWAREQLTDAEHAAAARELREEGQLLRRRLADLQQASDAPAPTEIAEAGRTLLRLWPEATVPQRNRMLREIVREVRVRPAGYAKEPVPDRVRVVPW